MAISKKRKFIVITLGVLFVLVALLPFVLGMALRGTVEKALNESLNVPVTLGGLSISVLSPGATLSDLVVGAPTPEAGNQPLANVKTLTVKVPFGTVLGGALQVNAIHVDGAVVHIGCNEKGDSTLTDFLSKQKSSTRDFPIPIDNTSVSDFSMYLHVPKKLMAPEANHAPEPIHVKLSRLEVIDLLLPAHNKPTPKAVWTRILLRDLTVRSPLKVEIKGSPESGEPIEEGITLASAEAQMLIPDKLDQPLQIQGVLLKGFLAKNIIGSKDLPETIERLHIAREYCLVSPPVDPNATGMELGNGSVYLADLAIKESEIEVNGFDAKGLPAYYRLNKLEIKGSKVAIGPGMDAPEDMPGHVYIESTSKSSEGDGRILLEWNNLVGHFPTWSFDKRLDISGVPLTPWSVRVEKNMNARVEKGTMATSFTGSTIDGNLHWDGSVTLSKDTKLVGEGSLGKMTEFLTKFATGDPIKTFRIRGTFLEPKFIDPDFVAGMAMNVFRKAFLNKETGVLGTFTKGMGAAVDQGVRETKNFFGGLFGGDKKKQE